MTAPSHAADPVPAPRRGRPRADPEQGRQQIVAAATALFLAKGFAQTSVEEIARAIGVTKRTIYDHVGDKEAVFRAVCRELGTGRSNLAFTAPLEDRPLAEVLEEMARLMVGSVLRPEVVALSRAIASERSRFPDLFMQIMDTAWLELNQALVAVFEGLQRQGRVAGIDPWRAANLFYDAIIGNRLFRATVGYDDPAMTDRELAERIEMFRRGYLDPA